MRVRKQVRAQGTARRVIPVRLVPQPQKDLLRDFLGEALVAEYATRQRNHRAHVTAIHLFERRVRQTTDRRHELAVAQTRELIAGPVHRSPAIRSRP